MADLAHSMTDKELEKMERHLSAIYRRAEKELSEKAEKYFARFEKLDEQKRALVDAGKMTEQQYMTWRQGKIMTGKHWTAMKEQVAAELLRTNETAIAYINGQLPKIYALNYNAVADGVNGKIKGYSFELVDAHTVKNLATSNKTFLPYKRIDIAKDKRWNMKVFQSEVMQGIIQGESMDKIAKRIFPEIMSKTDLSGKNAEEIKGIIKKNRDSAIRNARTMVTSAENKGRMDMMHDALDKGVEMQKVWRAASDSRTRDSHAALDGAIADIDDEFDNGLMYPGDPDGEPSEVYNCRCTLVYKVVGFKRLEVEQQRRDQIDTGYSGQIPSKDLDSYNENALNQIIKDTGYSRGDAARLQADLQEYLGGDYASFTAGKQVERVKVIDEGISKMPAYDGDIFRGMHLDKETAKSYISLSPGDTLEMKSISSWTSRKGVAERYGNISSKDTNSVLIQCIDNKTSVGVQHISKWGTSEAEVLARSTSSWEVIESTSISKYEYLKAETERKLEEFTGPKFKKRILENTLQELEENKQEYDSVYMIVVKVREI